MFSGQRTSSILNNLRYAGLVYDLVKPGINSYPTCQTCGLSDKITKYVVEICSVITNPT